MATAYELWKKEHNEIRDAQDSLLYMDYTEELHNVYSRQLEIIDEILIDLSPQLDDDQYEGITSWQYEDELKELKEKRAELEPLVYARIEKDKHEDLLKDLGMTQEQYDAHLKEVDEMTKKRKGSLARKKK
jgi:hypothetical protein